MKEQFFVRLQRKMNMGGGETRKMKRAASRERPSYWIRMWTFVGSTHNFASIRCTTNYSRSPDIPG